MSSLLPRLFGGSGGRNPSSSLQGRSKGVIERGAAPLQAFIREKVRAASHWRAALFGPFSREPHTTAYRLLNGEGDGLEGFVVDAYAGFLVVQVLKPEFLRSAPGVEEALDETLAPQGIVRKQRYAETGRGRVEQEVARGETPPKVLPVLEEGLSFEVELLGGLHTGLFTDMREERKRLRLLARGRRVLNTFAYTGAFSVAAAAGGASTVTSVDVVPGALECARRNFLLAGLDPNAHRFVRMEVIDYLRMAARRRWRFDAIVLDPPTFATFKSGRWSLRTGYPNLLERALAVLEPGGLLWAAANTESLSAARFEALVARGLRGARRHARLVATGGLPPDYPTPPGRPETRYLKVRVLQVD